MLNQYEGSAVAESDERIGELAGNNAAEQQVSLPAEMSTAQMLYSVVSHNVANPDKRIALSPEQGKEIMKDFVNFVAGSDEPPTTEDGRVKTFGEMDDNELLKCLSEYLGSAVANSSINGTIIETAQEMIAEQYMSDEELEDLPDPKSPRAKEIRERKLLEKMRDAAEAEAAQLKEIRDKWDKDTHDYGGEQLSGAEIMERINWFSKKENQEKVRNELIKNGRSEKEADEIIAKMKERDELMKRERDGDKAKPPLTAADRARLNALNKDRDVIIGTALVKSETKSETKIDVDRAVQLKSPKNETVVQAINTADQQFAELTRKSSSFDNKNSSTRVENISADVITPTSSESAYQYFSGAPIVKDAFATAANEQTTLPTTSEPKVNPAVTVAKLNNDVAAMM